MMKQMMFPPSVKLLVLFLSQINTCSSIARNQSKTTHKNLPPVIIVPNDIEEEINENQVLYIGPIEIYDPDINDDTEGRYEVTIEAQHGRIKLATLSGLSCVSDLDPMFYKMCPFQAVPYLKFRAFEEEVKEATTNIVYIPEEDYHGNDMIHIDVNDMGYTGFGGALNTQAIIPVKIRAVNTAPRISYFDDTMTVEEDESFPLKNYEIILSDVDATPYDIFSMNVSVSIGSIDGVLQHRVVDGNLTSLNQALTSMKYVPFKDSNLVSHGRDEIHITVNDHGFRGADKASSQEMEASEIFYVILNPVNDAPVIKMASNAPALLAKEDTILNIYGLEVFDPDVDEGGAGMLNVTFQIPHGTLRVVDPRLLRYMKHGQLSEAIHFLNVISEPLSLNTALNGLEYTPSPNFHGNVTLTVFINDMESFGSGGLLSSTSEFIIQVQSEIDSPFIDTPFSHDLSMDEDSILLLNGTTIFDVDGEAQSMYIATLSCDFGAISILPKTSTLQLLHFTSGPHHNNSNMNFYGNFEHVKEAMYNLQYAPSTNFNSNKFLSSDTITIQITRIHVGDLMANDNDTDYNRTEENTSSIQISILVNPVADFIELHFTPNSYVITWNNVLTHIGYVLEDPDINDDDFISASGTVVAEVECSIRVNHGFISIFSLEDIPNVVIIIQNEEDLQRWKTPTSSPWHKSTFIRFRSDVQGVRKVLDSMVYEPLSDWAGDDSIQVEIYRVVDSRGVIVDEGNSVAVGFVSANVSVIVAEDIVE